MMRWRRSYPPDYAPEFSGGEHRRTGGWSSCLTRGILFNCLLILVILLLAVCTPIAIVAVGAILRNYNDFTSRAADLWDAFFSGATRVLGIGFVLLEVLLPTVAALFVLWLFGKVLHGLFIIKLHARHGFFPAFISPFRKLREGLVHVDQQHPYRGVTHLSTRIQDPALRNGAGYIDALPPEEEREVSFGKKVNAVLFSSIADKIGAGQVLVGIRPDGSLRIETWYAAFKILAVLGRSGSGKTNTMAEKTFEVVRGGGRLIIGDPHGFKDDSLTNIISPLKDYLWPGTTWAIKHADIVQNVRLAREELERREQGAPCQPAIVLVLDEVGNLLRKEDLRKELVPILQKVGEEGRGFNFFLILGAQKLPAQVRDALISFIVHRAPKSVADKLMEHEYARQVPNLPTGVGFVLDAEGAIELFQQPLLQRADVQTFVNSQNPAGVWRGTPQPGLIAPSWPIRRTSHAAAIPPTPNPPDVSRVQTLPLQNGQPFANTMTGPIPQASAGLAGMTLPASGHPGYFAAGVQTTLNTVAQTTAGPLSVFLQECCVCQEDVWVTMAALYAAYLAWSAMKQAAPLERTEFAAQLQQQNFPLDKVAVEGISGVWIWRGVSLKGSS